MAKNEDLPHGPNEINPVGDRPPAASAGFGLPPDGTFHGQRVYDADKLAERSEDEADDSQSIPCLNPPRRFGPTLDTGRKSGPPIPERPPSQRRG